MELLLDTHVLLWAVFESKKLSREAQQAIALPENVIYVSIVSLWEIGIKQNLGRLSVPAIFFIGINHRGTENTERRIKREIEF